MERGVRIQDAAHRVIAWIDEQYVETVPIDSVSKLILQTGTVLVPA
jgi:hypothetical protein